MVRDMVDRAEEILPEHVTLAFLPAFSLPPS